MSLAKRILDLIVPFIYSVIEHFDGYLIISSDHGNLEDLSIKTHTLNPVPLFFSSPNKDYSIIDDVNNLMEVNDLFYKILKEPLPDKQLDL